jgi:hypothetical protein
VVLIRALPRLDWCVVYNFLHTTGNNRHFHYGGGNCQSLAHTVAGKEEEDRGEKEEST